MFLTSDVSFAVTVMLVFIFAAKLSVYINETDKLGAKNRKKRLR